VGAGSYHACALIADGRVFCWGDSSALQLGTDSVGALYNLPVQVAGLSDAVAIFVGWHHACARTSDQRMLCWGSNGYGEAGVGSAAGAILPTELTTPPGLGAVTVMSAGAETNCAVVGSTTYCWGINYMGSLGFDVMLPLVDTPTAVPALGAPAHISMGGSSFGVTATGMTACPWGNNFQNDVAAGADTGIRIYGPGTVPCAQFTANVDQVTTGAGTACVRLASGAVWCWGDNRSGQCGADPTLASMPPTQANQVPSLSAVRLASGYSFACAIPTGNRSIVCWGDNLSGSLGNGTRTRSFTPVPVTLTLPAGITVQDVASGSNSLTTYAILSDGSLLCWGDNGFGQCGNGDGGLGTFVATPIPVTPTW
jgi:alpha-tubulin suppressor-like RCC1 family protein